MPVKRSSGIRSEPLGRWHESFQFFGKFARFGESQLEREGISFCQIALAAPGQRMKGWQVLDQCMLNV